VTRMLDLAYVTLLDFLSRSPPRGNRDEACESRFVPVGEDTDGREKAAPPETDSAYDRPEKASRA